MPMPLSALPKAFNVPDTVKGYFPHLFNTDANQDYVGEWPAAHYYGADTMKEGPRAKLLEWLAQQQGKEFNFKG